LLVLLCHTSATQGIRTWQLSVNEITVGKCKLRAANNAL